MVEPLGVQPVAHPPEEAGELAEHQCRLFAILTGRDTRRTGKPTDALLVIEVSATSLRFDLGEKARRYAGAGYPEYWVIDVPARAIHVHRGPRPDCTWAHVTVREDGELTAVAVPPVTIDVADLLDF